MALNPYVPLIVTEGLRKADAAVSVGVCCLGLLGVWNWRGRNEVGGATALVDWERIALKGRSVYLAFDLTSFILSAFASVTMSKMLSRPFG
jgi:hypothetical protein